MRENELVPDGELNVMDIQHHGIDLGMHVHTDISAQIWHLDENWGIPSWKHTGSAWQKKVFSKQQIQNFKFAVPVWNPLQVRTKKLCET